MSRSDRGVRLSPHKKGPEGPFLCGDGRTRTAVQTTHQEAFYTLSLSLIVGPKLPEGRPPQAYPLDLGGALEEWLRASGLDDAPDLPWTGLKDRGTYVGEAALASRINAFSLGD